MKYLFPSILLSLLLPAGALAADGLILINGTDVNLREKPSSQSRIIERMPRFALAKGDTAAQKHPGASWYRVTGLTDGTRTKGFAGRKEAWVSAALARPVPAPLATVPKGRPAAKSLHFTLPKKIPAPAGVNAAELRRNLQSLINRYNGVIDRCAALPPVFADVTFLGRNDPFEPFRIDEIRSRLYPCLAPLLKNVTAAARKNGWSEKKLPQMLDPQSAALLKLLNSLGIRITLFQGDVVFSNSIKPVRERFRPLFSKDFQDWTDFRTKMPEWFDLDGRLTCRVADVCAFAVRTEAFIAQHRGSLYRKAAEDFYAELMGIAMFCHMDETQAFRGPAKTMDAKWADALEQTVRTSPNSRTAQVFSQFLTMVRANRMTEPAGLRAAMTKLVRAPF